MAIWQYNFFLIPKDTFLGVDSQIRFDDEGCFEDDFYWSEFSTEVEFFKKIETILPLGKSWHNDLLLFGHEASNCFEVWVENNVVESVSFRIDFTSNYVNIFKLIVEFAQKNNLVILDEKFRLLTSNFKIELFIEQSPQFYKYNQLQRD